MGARMVCVALGLWLFASAFAWPHSIVQFNNAWVSGLLVVVFAIVAMAAFDWGRYLNAGIAAWLFASSFLLPGDDFATKLHHAAVAMAIFLAAMIPARPVLAPHGRGASV